MIFDDLIAEESIINKYFCRARQENCDMIYLKQNIFSADRQNVRENCNLFIFSEQTGKAITAIYYDHILDLNLVIMILVIYAKRYSPSVIIKLSLINLRIDMIVVN